MANVRGASPAGELFLKSSQLPDISSMFRRRRAATLRQLTDLEIDELYLGVSLRVCSRCATQRKDLAICAPPAQVEPISTAYHGDQSF